MKKKLKKLPISNFYRAALIASISAIIPVLLTWFHISNPYFYTFKFVKIVMFSITFMIPAYLELFLGFARIPLVESAIYILTYLVNFLIYLVLIYAFLKAKNKRLFMAGLATGIIIFVALSVFVLW
ncbi:MAG: hypothetical protein AABX51_01240 [Nanoarchaeota archaeon]